MLNDLKLIYCDLASVVQVEENEVRRRNGNQKKRQQMKENNDFLFWFHCIEMGLPTRVKVTLKDYRIKYSR